MAPLLWTSRRLRCVAKSALAAEAMVMLEGVEHAFLISTLIHEVVGGIKVPIVGITDSKSLYESIKTTKVVEDKRTHIVLKEK